MIDLVIMLMKEKRVMLMMKTLVNTIRTSNTVNNNNNDDDDNSNNNCNNSNNDKNTNDHDDDDHNNSNNSNNDYSSSSKKKKKKKNKKKKKKKNKNINKNNIERWKMIMLMIMKMVVSAVIMMTMTLTMTTVITLLELLLQAKKRKGPADDPQTTEATCHAGQVWTLGAVREVRGGQQSSAGPWMARQSRTRTADPSQSPLTPWVVGRGTLTHCHHGVVGWPTLTHLPQLKVGQVPGTPVQKKRRRKKMGELLWMPTRCHGEEKASLPGISLHLPGVGRVHLEEAERRWGFRCRKRSKKGVKIRWR